MKTLLCAAVVLAAGCAPAAVHPANWVTSEHSALETAPQSGGPAVATGGRDLLPTQQLDEANPVTAPEGVDLWAEFFAQSSASPASARVATTLPQPEATAPTAPTATEPAAQAAANDRAQPNDRVRYFLDQFQTGDRRAVVERWLTRSGRYLPMILEVFKQTGLPEELAFTAMIESGFDPIAVSCAGAKGLWQFMAPTARRYGLRVDRWLDERLDPEKSTMAAAHYLRDLHTVFGSWELAQAAYNAGAMKVERAIRGAGTRDFWTLSRSRWLRDETKDYVPQIHAATLIGQEPERYGFAVTPEQPLHYEQIAVPRATTLRRIAALAGIPLKDLERLNSALRQKQTPPESSYQLKVPLGSARALRAGLQREVTAHKVAASSRAADRTKRKSQVTKAAPAGGVLTFLPANSQPQSDAIAW
jgi:soluble lytic murein transglycosylase-like protein